MKHTAAFRHSRILGRLRESGEVRAAELSRALGVTAMTVWRDLRELGEQGLLRKVRGGAVSGVLAGEQEFETKAPASSRAKRAIAKCAAGMFVREGRVIGLEGGSTVAAMLDFLPLERITIVTNSLPVALRVRAVRPALPVKLLGGWLSQISGNTCGKEALREAARSRLDVMFLSATGWDWSRGPVDPNPLEIEVKRTLAERAGKVVFLMDRTKFGVPSPSVVLHPRRIDTLIVDGAPTGDFTASLTRQGVGAVVSTRAPRRK